MRRTASIARDIIKKHVSSEFDNPGDPYVHTAYKHCVRDLLIQAYQRLCVDLVEFDNLLYLYDHSKDHFDSDPSSSDPK